MGDSFHAEVGMLLFQRHHLRFDGRGHLGRPGFAATNQWLESGFSLFPVAPNPPRQDALTDTRFPGDQVGRITFLQPQLDPLAPQFERIGLAAAPRKPPKANELKEFIG